ncbi:hypothetical protein BSN85_18065 [Bradyrhizobium brasilense]|nr:hypothetical protein BSN85_18065 [Bradyrhizobium brasilense]
MSCASNRGPRPRPACSVSWRIDEVVTACNGDLRSALKVLLLVDEQFEHILNCLNATLNEHMRRHHRQQALR